MLFQEYREALRSQGYGRLLIGYKPDVAYGFKADKDMVPGKEGGGGLLLFLIFPPIDKIDNIDKMGLGTPRQGGFVYFVDIVVRGGILKTSPAHTRTPSVYMVGFTLNDMPGLPASLLARLLMGSLMI